MKIKNKFYKKCVKLWKRNGSQERRAESTKIERATT